VPAGVTLADLPSGCTLAAGVVTCVLALIADGATSTITLNGTVAADRTDAIVAPRSTPPTGSSSRTLAGLAALLLLSGLFAVGGTRRRSAPGQ
jgi:hypothetical protein